MDLELLTTAFYPGAPVRRAQFAPSRRNRAIPALPSGRESGSIFHHDCLVLCVSHSNILIVSDIHYAGAAEQARRDFEWRGLPQPGLRCLARLYYRHIWMRDPFAHNARLDCFSSHPEPPDCVVANGDFSCDSAFVGVSDDAAFASAQECLGKLRAKFGAQFHGTIGDHELGKVWLFGERGGMRLASWTRTVDGLGLQPFWRVTLGNYVLLGVTSSLLALPVYRRDTLPDEWAGWEKLRARHLAEIHQAFADLHPEQRVLLFCHDPTALPFLWEDELIRSRLTQVEQTIIGHLHTPLVLWKSRRLAGMPRVSFLGNGIHRMTTALRNARRWRPFNVRLCPSLAGIELLKDGGYYTAKIDLEARQPAEFQFHALPR